MNTLFETGQDGGTATTHDWLNRCYFGDRLETLRRMPGGIVNTCVTSPPYFGLRDYGHAGQIGLEPTPEEFVAKLVTVFREVRRVLRDDGTLWLNIGDSYASNPASGGRQTGKMTGGEHKRTPSERKYQRPEGLKPKDLIGVPWTLAFALRADGWYLRQEIIWSKPNPMPESVRDRCTKSHEQIFLLAKSANYYYDQKAIMKPAIYGEQHAKKTTSFGTNRKHPNKANTADYAFKGDNSTCYKDESGVFMKNRRSVWTVSTKPYKGAHFATFPPDLIEPCVLAGAPTGGVVLDPFFGSGTTGQVAQQLGRKFIGIELNPAYKALQDERLRQPSLMLEAA